MLPSVAVEEEALDTVPETLIVILRQSAVDGSGTSCLQQIKNILRNAMKSVAFTEKFFIRNGLFSKG